MISEPNISGIRPMTMVAAHEGLEEVVSCWTALVAAGMDRFMAIAPAAGGDRLTAGHLWMEAMRLVEIPAGTFKMGSPKAERRRKRGYYDDEGPVHKETIPQSLRMSAVTVTQGAWEALMGENPSVFTGESDLPADNASRFDIGGPNGFLARLNTLTEDARPSGTAFRLPSDVEWEYACRAGTSTAYSFGNDPAGLGAHGWFNVNSEGRTHPVGRKAPNPWGLFDMHGNVQEWCADSWDEDFDEFNVAQRDWPNRVVHAEDEGLMGCVLRGGDWDSHSMDVRSACRRYPLVDVLGNLGFRPVLARQSVVTSWG